MMKKLSLLTLLLALAVGAANATQIIRITNLQQGKRFDGIGAVNGGGATSVLLKDYPEPQRSQIMDLVFKPMFGASVSAMLVEVPGDGNSTQGSMPSHSHYRGDNNFMRGYIWWVMREAHQRNPQLALDATAWSSPAWVGSCWSDDMVDYYIAWMQGLRQVHGMELDALGCHNERGWNGDFAKKMRKAMNERGFKEVKLHGFGNWGKSKLDFVKYMQQDKELAAVFGWQVHPHVRGAHRGRCCSQPGHHGPSPRAWGSRRSASDGRPNPSVHPHVRGAHRS